MHACSEMMEHAKKEAVNWLTLAVNGGTDQNIERSRVAKSASSNAPLSSHCEHSKS